MIKKWLNYYDTVLRNAERAKVEITSDGIKPSDIGNFILPKEVLDRIKSKAQKTNKETSFLINVDMIPVRWSFEIKEGTKKNVAQEVGYPFVIPAVVNEKGELKKPEKALPFFVRDYLDPNPQDHITIAESEKVDEALKLFDFSQCQTFQDFYTLSERFFEEVTGKRFEEANDEIDNCLHIENSSTREGITNNIKMLYQRLLSEENDLLPALLKNMLTGEEPNPRTNLSHSSSLHNTAHLGQMSTEFPLSKSQRDSIRAFTETVDGEVLAVNGPPGTGKTTLLQSVVANIIVSDVLAQRSPSLIVASSTNNQAITNILDSFNQDEKSGNPLTKRWLPEVSSLGLYFVGEKKADPKYQCYTSIGADNSIFPATMESKSPEGLQAYFLKHSNTYFSRKDVKLYWAKKHLYSEITSHKERIEAFFAAYKAFEAAQQRLSTMGYGSLADFQKGIAKKQTALTTTQNQLAATKQTEANFLKAQAQTSVLEKLLAFFSSATKKRLAMRYERVLTEGGFSLSYHSKGQVLVFFDEQVITLTKQCNNAEQELTALTAQYETFAATFSAYNALNAEWQKQYGNRLDNLYRKTGDEYQTGYIWLTLNVMMDISYRAELFWLAIHYREAEYITLLEEKNKLSKGEKPAERGKETYKKKLQRFACLTPLFIATFHTLPRFATYYGREGEKPYYDLFDYLIVDEAGQVAPDVSLPSFALAKKAIVVGDTFQIEPVWSVSPQMDVIFLKQNKLAEEDALFEKITKEGRTAYGGNLMRLTQRICKYENPLSAGTMLTEHRRCPDNIINFCNDYVYNGLLEPKKGVENNFKSGLPAKGFLNVDNPSTKVGSSRRNLKEAQVIAQWLIDHSEALIKAYDKPIEKIVAVVTPYSSQAKLICSKLPKELSKITIGTVHSLQGAEIPIVIFSLVCSKGDSLQFINGQYNMLNVAVSRAKESFIVFGNIGILNAKQNTPLGNLKKWLLTEPNPEINNAFIFTEEIDHNAQVRFITSLEKHIEILEISVKTFTDKLLIISPFLSAKALKHNALIDLIAKRIREDKMSITVLTDEFLDQPTGTLKAHAKEARELLISAGVKLIIFDGVHSKTICYDDRAIIEGSFNWLSASREEGSKYQRKESSIIIENNKELIQKRIETLKKDFNITD